MNTHTTHPAVQAIRDRDDERFIREARCIRSIALFMAAVSFIVTAIIALNGCATASHKPQSQTFPDIDLVEQGK